MPYRIGEEFPRAYGVEQTGEAARVALQQQARAEARPFYQQAERSPTWSPLIQEMLDDPLTTAGLRHGVERQRIAAAGTGRPFDPLDAVLDPQGNVIGVPNTRTLQTLKMGLDNMIARETDGVTGAVSPYGRDLLGFKNRLTAEMGRVNPAYAEANRLYAGPMQIRDAIEAGRRIPTTGRAEDTMRAFGGLAPASQQGQRIGAVDTVLKQLERTGNIPAYLRAKVPKGTQEIQAMALPGRAEPLRRFLGREETMQATGRHALGGSATAENLADMAAAPGGLSEAFGMASAAAHGNPIGFARSAYDFVSRTLKGETEKQRMAITRALLTSDPTAAQALAARLTEHEARRRGVNPFTY